MITITDVETINYNSHGEPIEQLTITNGVQPVQFITDENCIWENLSQVELNALFDEVHDLTRKKVRGYKFI